MKTMIRASALAIFALLLGSADAGAQFWRRSATPQNGACFYENANFSGQSFCIDTNSTNPLVGMNDRISSIRLFGNAAVTVYQDRDFQGRSATFSSDVYDLTRNGWNDTITSVRVRAAGGGLGRFGRGAVPANGVCFYENIDFSGQYFCSNLGDTVEMVPAGANDQISSIRLFGNAELVVYRDRDFGGPTQWFDGSTPDLRESGWNDTISSYRVESRGAFGNRGRGYGYGRGGGYGDDRYNDRYGNRPGYNEPTSGSLEWRGRVDNRVQLVIRGRSLQERTLSGTRMGEGRTYFSSGLPDEPVRVSVRTLAGRGDVRVVQQPSRQNGYTAIVEINDPMRGAEEQRLQVIWR
jgi:peptidase inhibitor family I36